MVDSNAFLNVMEGFVDAIQEFLVAIQDFLDAIQDPDWMPYKFSWMPYKISWMPYKIQTGCHTSFLGCHTRFPGCHTRAIETKNVLFGVYPVYFVRLYPPLHGFAKTRKKIFIENLATMVRSCNENFVWRVWNHISLLDMVAKKGQHGLSKIKERI